MVTQIQEEVWAENVKITEEAASADEEVAATFLAELKKLIRVPYYSRFQASSGVL